MEQELKREVNKKHPNWSDERKDKYIYGTMHKVAGWTRGKKNSGKQQGS